MDAKYLLPCWGHFLGEDITLLPISFLYIWPLPLLWFVDEKMTFLKIVLSTYISRDPWILYFQYKLFSKLHNRMTTCLWEIFSCMFYKNRKSLKWTWFKIPHPIQSYSCYYRWHVYISQGVQWMDWLRYIRLYCRKSTPEFQWLNTTVYCLFVWLVPHTSHS